MLKFKKYKNKLNKKEKTTALQKYIAKRVQKIQRRVLATKFITTTK